MQLAGTEHDINVVNVGTLHCQPLELLQDPEQGMGVLPRHEPGRPATVLGRPGSTPGDTLRDSFAGPARPGMFNAYLVNPRVAEVVLVNEALTDTQLEPRQRHGPGVFVKPHATIAVDAELPAMNTEAVKMGILPTKRNLDHLMKISQPHITADEQPTPDQRADTPQHDPQLKH